METVTSPDGTMIAFDRLGSGPPLVVLGGATCDRARTRPTADALAEHFTVLNVDRRGRGDSSDVQPYDVEREVEDVAAVIAAGEDGAMLYGHSSGAGLALHAAAAGLPLGAVVLHEAPYTPGDEESIGHARAFAAELEGLLASDRRGEALDYFFTTVGMPPEMIEAARTAPDRPEQEALAQTLAYDSRVMGDADRGGTIPVELLNRVRVPALVLTGDAGPDFFVATARVLADGLPDGRLQVLEGEGHVVEPSRLAQVVAQFA